MIVSERENDTKKGCIDSLSRELKKLKSDPNNYPYKFSIESSPSKKVIDGNYNVKIRRQRTSNGPTDPLSLCDDSGRPLTNEDGSPKWGQWHDCDEKVVGDKRSGKYSRCFTEKLCRWGHFSSEKEAQRNVDALLRSEEKAQKNRKNKIHIEYTIEEKKKPSSKDIWMCKITKEKVRDFPSTWEDVNIKPKSDYAMPISFKRHKISKKTGKQLSQTTGVGNFRGKQSVIKELKNNEIFGMYRFHEELANQGFKISGDSYYSRMVKYLPIPDSKDVCTVSTSRRDFPFIASSWVTRNLRSSDNKIPLGGYFEHATFGVGKKVGERSDPIIKYQKKAPKKSVEFCQKIANKIAENSLIDYVEIF